MEVSVSSAVNVSILAMSVIFAVLVILIFTIKTLVKLIPYQESPLAQVRKIVASTPEQDDHVAAITASLAAHTGKSPDEFRIVNIQSR